VEPQIKYTVWFTAYDGDYISKNIVRGSQLFKTEAEATTFIDNYADQLLMQGIAGSYGVMTWEV
jgi:ABC-type Fe3+-hydroxamate transport system substrate-binding protein